MSIVVKNMLREFNLYELATREDRREIDREIEKRTGKNCGMAGTESFEHGLRG